MTDAEIIANLHRSYTTLHEQFRRIYHENLELRPFIIEYGWIAQPGKFRNQIDDDLKHKIPDIWNEIIEARGEYSTPHVEDSHV